MSRESRMLAGILCVVLPTVMFGGLSLLSFLTRSTAEYVFVVTHEEKDKLITAGGTTYTFVTDGLQSAVNRAKAASGEKDVMVAGGANIVQQLVKSQLLDELQIHLVPLLLGEGQRLFDQLGNEHIELEILRVIQSPEVTHLRFRIMK